MAFIMSHVLGRTTPVKSGVLRIGFCGAVFKSSISLARGLGLSGDEGTEIGSGDITSGGGRGGGLSAESLVAKELVESCVTAGETVGAGVTCSVAGCGSTGS